MVIGVKLIELELNVKLNFTFLSNERGVSDEARIISRFGLWP